MKRGSDAADVFLMLVYLQVAPSPPGAACGGETHMSAHGAAPSCSLQPESRGVSRYLHGLFDY